MNEHRNDWIDHPAMEKIDPLKRELIRTAAKQTQGKSGNSLAPVMMALITSANKKGIRFEPEEISLIMEILKDGKSREEQEQIDRINTLYHKSQSVGLTEEEKAEQAALRREYIESIRNSLRGHLNSISIVEKDGTITDLGKKYGHIGDKEH